MKIYVGNNTHGHQPEGPSSNPTNPPKAGSGVTKLTDSLMEETLIDRIEAIEKRLSVLENKRPEYLQPPVIGPTKQYCNRCGNYVDINHICFGR